MIIIDFLYILGICCATVAECLFKLQTDYQLYTMFSSLPILSIWCLLRIKNRRIKNNQIYMLVLLLIANTLRTVANTHISEMLLYIIPLQNHQHPKKVFLCLPFVGVIASVKLEFNYDHTLIAYCFVLLVWLSNSNTIDKMTKISKNRSYSKTWNNPSDSLIISHNEQYHLIVNHQGKMISSNEDMKKLLGSDDPIIVQQIINEIIIKKVDKQIKERKMLNLLQMINCQQPKCKILDCSTSFGDHYMIELINYNDNVGMIFIDLYECREYWERKITKQLMSQLFRSFSHEFSTSLNCIRILAESAVEDIDDDYVVNNILQPILNSCYILNSIVQDVRDFSLILSKNFIFTIQIQNIYLLINEVADLYRQQLSMKGVELNIKMNEIYIHTDGQRFKQVLNNLLSNAQKFTFNGNITITLIEQIVRDQVFVKVSVSDTGSGMNIETQSKLKEFLNQPHKRQSNFNYGLGLMISNSICNGLSPNYESGIHFESHNQNGSVFWFYLEDLKMLETPDLISKRTIKYNKIISSGRSVLEQSFLISPSDKKRQSSFTFSLKGKQKLIDKNSENFSEPDENICAPYIFRETKKPKKSKHSPKDHTTIEVNEDRVKILIVDDEFVNIYALTTMFSRLNIKCDQAHNGKEGLDKFKQHYYQVILMDIEMPIMNGIQATSLIIEYCSSVDLDPPIIIAQTAYTDMQTKQMCKEAGMDYFLQKPISTNEIKQILQTIKFDNRYLSNSSSSRKIRIAEENQKLTLLNTIIGLVRWTMEKDSYQFLQQFYPFHMEMRDQLEFTPHYAIAGCEGCKKNIYLKPNQHCLSGGRYCATDPDGDGILNGQDAIREILRQLCIFKQDQINWWKYIIKYSNLCLSKMYFPFLLN